MQKEINDITDFILELKKFYNCNVDSEHFGSQYYIKQFLKGFLYEESEYKLFYNDFINFIKENDNDQKESYEKLIDYFYSDNLDYIKSRFYKNKLSAKFNHVIGTIKTMSNEDLFQQFIDYSDGDDYDGSLSDYGECYYSAIFKELMLRLEKINFIDKDIIKNSRFTYN